MRIEHPDIDQTATCSEKAFEQIWRPKGWEPVPEAEAAKIEAEQAREQYDTDPYDPADHTVQEVVDHIAMLDEGDPEIQRIIDSERNNKNRSGIVG